ncbi:helix-turn-helix transcriptional regulator [Streptomyces sp. NPDC052225]|uniref:helix-turn-helix transcriptional regulator n=1 Tax=Streptomyces sp. NPDC052225 TaxID=3154949 RepID=UPI003419E9AD
MTTTDHTAATTHAATTAHATTDRTPPRPDRTPPRGRDRRRTRPELAAFLKSRRARVTPADVGMPAGPRRRTPGLRREEVAQLSGVGVTWYTWLEQGRPINASPQVLDAVARTLRLDRPEREHLYHLAEVAYEPAREATSEVVGPDIQGIIDALDPLPAVVYNARFDLLTTNAAYRALFILSPETLPRLPNALRTLFLAPEATCPLVLREAELPVMVATLRSGYGRHVGEPAWEDFIRELAKASPYFAELWESGDVVPPGPRVKVFRHRAVEGELRMTSASLSINGMPECRIVVYSPVDEETHELLAAVRADNEKSRP